MVDVIDKLVNSIFPISRLRSTIVLKYSPLVGSIDKTIVNRLRNIISASRVINTVDNILNNINEVAVNSIVKVSTDFSTDFVLSVCFLYFILTTNTFLIYTKIGKELGSILFGQLFGDLDSKDMVTILQFPRHFLLIGFKTEDFSNLFDIGNNALILF